MSTQIGRKKAITKPQKNNLTRYFKLTRSEKIVTLIIDDTISNCFTEPETSCCNQNFKRTHKQSLLDLRRKYFWIRRNIDIHQSLKTHGFVWLTLFSLEYCTLLWHRECLCDFKSTLFYTHTLVLLWMSKWHVWDNHSVYVWRLCLQTWQNGYCTCRQLTLKIIKPSQLNTSVHAWSQIRWKQDKSEKIKNKIYTVVSRHISKMFLIKIQCHYLVPLSKLVIL